MRTKRAMRNVRYNVEMELSRPLGWSSRDTSSCKLQQHQQQQQFELKSEHSFPGSQYLVRAQAHERCPSTQASVRGSFRSEGSGQSALHTAATQSLATSSSIRRSPFQFAPHLSPTRLSSPERFRASSAMQMMLEEQEPSMSRLPSGLDRSSMLQSSLSSRQELPLLRPIHQHQHIYQNIGPFANTGSYFRSTMPLPTIRAIRPIPYNPAIMRSEQHVPYSPRSTLGLRHSQRRRYDMKIAQIRRERDSRVQLQYSRPPFIVGNNRLCQV